MKTQDFNFSLPPGLIAQFPITKRAGSRMLCLDGKKGALQDAMFVDLMKDWLTLLYNGKISNRLLPRISQLGVSTKLIANAWESRQFVGETTKEML